MRQRNVSGSTLTIPELGRQVGPGEEIDHPDLICGFEAIEPPPAKPAKPAKAAPAQDQETSK